MNDEQRRDYERRISLIYNGHPQSDAKADVLERAIDDDDGAIAKVHRDYAKQLIAEYRARKKSE